MTIGTGYDMLMPYGTYSPGSYANSTPVSYGAAADAFGVKTGGGCTDSGGEGRSRPPEKSRAQIFSGGLRDMQNPQISGRIGRKCIL